MRRRIGVRFVRGVQAVLEQARGSPRIQLALVHQAGQRALHALGQFVRLVTEVAQGVGRRLAAPNAADLRESLVVEQDLRLVRPGSRA